MKAMQSIVAALAAVARSCFVVPAKFSVPAAAVLAAALLLPQAAQAQTPSVDRVIVTVVPATVAEGNNPSTGSPYTILITVRCAGGANCRSALPSSRWSITYGGSAVAADFTGTRRTGFPALGASGTTRNSLTSFSFGIADDNLIEGTENLTVDIALTGSTPYTIDSSSDTSFTVTINDNDTSFRVTAGPTTIDETDADAASDNFTITRTGAELTGSTTVTWTINHGTAGDATDSPTEAADFAAVTGTVTFAAGDDTETFAVTVAGDNVSEATENFNITVAAGGHQSGAAYASSIIDDDGATFTPVPPSAPVAEGSAPTWQVRYAADDGSTALAAEATVTATITGAAPTGTNLAASGYPAGLTSERTADPATDFAAATATCTIAANTAHNALVNCALPMVTQDTLSERVEHYQVELSGGPTGAQYGDPAFHTIAASDPINMSIASATYSAAEGGSVTVRVNISVDEGATVTVPSGLTQFRLLFDDGGTTYRRETPGVGNFLDLLGTTPVWERTNAYHEFTVDSTQDTDRENHDVQTWRLRGVHDVGVHVVIGTGTTVITFTDDEADEWTVRARGGGLASEDVNEDATPIATPGTQDTTTNHADTMYFRFTTYNGGNLRGAATVTYCLRGTATGVTQDALTATPGLAHDYIYPAGYDPTSNSAAHADYPSGGACATANGRGTFMVSAGIAPHYRLRVQLNDDSLNEGDETIIAEVVNVEEAGGYVATVDDDATDSIATRTIKDNDPVIAAIANAGTDADGDNTNGFQVAEGGSAEFTVTLTGGTRAGSVTIAYAISGDVATADYTDSGSGTIVIAAGATQGTISIDLAEDDDTASEALTVTIPASGHTAAGAVNPHATNNAATQNVITRQSARTLILTRFTDDTHATTATGTAIAEDAGTLYYGVSIGLGQTAFTDATVVTWTATAAATNGIETSGANADISANTGTFTWPAADGPCSTNVCRFSFNITNDMLNEPTEGFSIALSLEGTVSDTDDGGTNTGAGSGDLTITDNDRVRVGLGDDLTVTEGSSAVVVVDLGVIPTSEITINFSETAVGALSGISPTGSGTAATITGEEGLDIGAVMVGSPPVAGTSLVFAIGQQTANLTIPILADNLNEAEEEFNVHYLPDSVSGDYGSTGVADPAVDGRGGGGATITIPASNPITISIARVGGATVNEGTSVDFTVTLVGASAGSAAAISVPYTFTSLPASTPAYAPTVATAGASPLAFAIGDLEKTITVNLPISDLGDMDDDQTLTVTLTPDDAATTETDEGPTVGAAGGSVQLSATAASATATINFLDAARVLTVTGPTSITEGDAGVESGNYTISLSGANFTETSTTVTWTVTHGTTADADFAAADDRSGTVTFTAADTSQTFTLTVAGDNLNEPTETFSVQVEVTSTAPAGGVAYGAAAGTEIVDDDPIILTLSAADVTEGNTASVTITAGGGARSGNAHNLIVRLLVDGEGVTASDWSPAAGSLFFGPTGGNYFGSGTARLDVLADNLNEATETFTISIAPFGTSTSGTRWWSNSAEHRALQGEVDVSSTTEIEVAASDAITVTLANRDGRDADGDTAGHQVREGREAEFTVTFTGATAGSVADITVPFAITGTATPADDYTAPTPLSITIPAGQTSGTIRIPVALDMVADADETGETIVVTLTEENVDTGAAGISVGPGGTDDNVKRSETAGEITATQIIIPGGNARTLTVTGPGNIMENTSPTFTITLDGTAFTADTTVTWTVTPGTAAADDFENAPMETNPLTGSVTFGSDDGSAKEFRVAVVADLVNEDDETFTVQVSVADADADGGTTIGAPVTVNIPDDDQLTVQTRLDRATANEGDRVVLTVSITNPGGFSARVSRNVTIDYSGANIRSDDDAATIDAATADGVDFDRPSPDTITFTPGGSSNIMMNFDIVNDNLSEAAEVFRIRTTIGQISGAYGNTMIAASSSATLCGGTCDVTIAASDAITVQSIARADGLSTPVNEGTDLAFTVTLTGAAGGSAAAITVPYTVETSGDYVVTGSSPLVIPASTSTETHTTGTITLTLPRTAAATGSQAVTVELTADDAATSDADEGPTVAPGGNLADPPLTATVADRSETVTVDFVPDARTLTLTRYTDGNYDTEATSTTVAEGDTLYFAVSIGATETDFGAVTTVNRVVDGAQTADFSSHSTDPVQFPATGKGGGDCSTCRFNFVVTDDNINEAAETFTVSLSVADPSAGGGTAYAAPTTYTISANDPVTVALASHTLATAGQADEAGNVPFRATLAGGTLQSGVSVVIPFTVSGDLENSEFDITAHSLLTSVTATGATITTGATTVTGSGSLSINLVNDNLNEADETLTVTGVDPSATGLRLTGAGGTFGNVEYATGGKTFDVTVLDNNDITVSIARHADTPATVNERGTAQFTVTLTGATDGSVGAITVPYTVTTSGSYAVTGSSPLRIAAGGTSGTITINLPQSTALGSEDDDQTLTVTLTADDATTTETDEGPTAGTGGGDVAVSGTSGEEAASVTVNFVDAAHSITVDSPTVTETDGNSTATFTLSRVGPAVESGQNIVVTVTVTAGTATAADFSGGTVPAARTFTFSGGDATTTPETQTFSIGIAGDNLNEDDETFTIALSIASANQAAVTANNGVSLPDDQTVTINDDDLIDAVIGATATAVSEGGADATVSVNLGAIPTRDITVAYAITGGAAATTATDDVDATLSGMGADITDSSGGSITITASGGVATGTISLGITDDMLNEAAESFTVTITDADITGEYGAAAEVASGGTRTFTIAASDTITASIARASGTSATVNEGETAQFTVTFAGAGTVGSAAEITVTYAVRLGAAADGYTTTQIPATGSISIAAGRTTGAISIATPSITKATGSQTITVTLGAVSAYEIDSGGGRVSRGSPDSATVTVNFQAAAHTFRVSRVSGAMATPITTADTVAETDADAAITYTVTRSGPNIMSGDTLTVTYTVAAGDAEANDFYGQSPANVSFTGMETTKTFSTIGIRGDNRNEPSETITITFSIAGPDQQDVDDNGDVSLPPAITLTITDDDPIILSLSGGGTVSEAGSTDADRTSRVTINVGGGERTAAHRLAGVRLEVSGTGVTGSDWSAPNTATGFVYFRAAGGNITNTQNTRPADLIVANDSLNEAQETIVVSLVQSTRWQQSTPPTGTERGEVQFSSTAGSVNIVVTDNDPVVASIANAGTDADDTTSSVFDVEEGDEAMFTVTIADTPTRASGAVHTIGYTIASGTGNVAAGDYTDRTGGSVTITAPDTEATIRIFLNEDPDTEPENLVVTLAATGSSTNAGVIQRATAAADYSATQSVVTRTAAHRFTLTSPAATIDETDGTVTTQYMLARTGPAITGAGITVTWTVTAGSTDPVVAADFSGDAFPTGTLTFTGSRASRRTFNIVIAGDNLNEADETFDIAFTIASAHQAAETANGGASLPSAQTVTINDDDAIAAVISGGGRVNEGGNAVVTVNLGAIPTTRVSVAYTIGNDTDANTADALLSGSLAQVDITDAAGAAFTNLSDELVFAADGTTTTGTITIGINDEEINEGEETFIVTISAPGIFREHGTATVSSGGTQTFTIVDDDPITVTLAADASTVNEGQSADFTVTLTDGAGNTRASAGPITVAYDIAGVSDATGDPASPLSFAAGDTSATITVTVPNSDRLGDGSTENMVVSLGAITPDTAMGAGAASGTGSETVVVTHQSAARTLTVTGPSTVTEGTGSSASSSGATYTVTLTGTAFTAASTTVTWTVTNDTTQDADFVAAADRGGMVTFASTDGNDSTKTFDVRIVRDDLNEANESFTVQVSVANANADGGTTYGSPWRTTITDDDALSMAISIGGSTSVAEDASAGFTFTLGGMPSGDVVVPFTLSGLDASEYGDITRVSPGTTSPTLTPSGAGGTVTFAMGGSNTLSISVDLTDDTLNEATEMLTITGGALTDGVAAAGAIDYTSDAVRTADVMITDDDDITVSITGPSATVDEYGTAEYTVSFANSAGTAIASAGPIDVAYTVAWTGSGPSTGTYTDEADPDGSITIAAGQMSGPIRLTIDHSTALTDDSDDSTLTVTLSTITPDTAMGAGAATGTGMADATVNWITARHVMTLVSPAATIDETDSSLTQQYTMMRGGDAPAITGDGITVTWDVMHGTTTAADFTGATTGTVTFTGMQTSQTFSIGIAGDNLSEMNETFTIAFSIASAHQAAATANNGVAPPADHSVTINDDDDISITITAPSNNEVREMAMVSIPVGLGATPTADLTVAWAVAAASGNSLAITCANPGTDTVAAAFGDFASDATATATRLTSFPSGTLDFYTDAGVGSATQDIVFYTSAGVEVNGSADNSCDRQFTLTLSMISSAGGGSGATPMAPMAITITIREFNPQAIVELNEAVLPEVARAVVVNQVGALAERVGQATSAIGASLPSFNINGSADMAGAAAANIRRLAGDDGVDLKDALRDADFVMPLSAAGGGGGAGGNRLALWGGSDYRDFKGEDGTTNWDGEMFSLHLGVDGKVRENLLAGVMVSHSDAESDYAYEDGGIERGDYEVTMTSFSPYLSWDLPGGEVWVSVGYGEGDLEIQRDSRPDEPLKSDVSMTSVGGGISRALKTSDAHELRLKGDVFASEVDVDGGTGQAADDLLAVSVDASRARVMLESRFNFQLASGAQMTPIVDAGARYDGGDGRTGSGLELGGGVNYHDAAFGLTVEGRARVLVGHTGDHDEWGIGGLVRLAPGRDGQGLSLSLAPSYGDAEGSAQALWDNGVLDAPTGAGAGSAGSSAANSADKAARLTAEVGFGLPAARFGLGDLGGLGDGGGGLLTPYSAMQFGNAKRDYRLGLRWTSGQNFGLNLSAGHINADNAASDNTLTLQGKVRF